MNRFLAYAMGLALVADSMNDKHAFSTEDQKPYRKTPLTKKQANSRKKAKTAKHSRKRNHK